VLPGKQLAAAATAAGALEAPGFAEGSGAPKTVDAARQRTTASLEMYSVSTGATPVRDRSSFALSTSYPCVSQMSVRSERHGPSRV